MQKNSPPKRQQVSRHLVFKRKALLGCTSHCNSLCLKENPLPHLPFVRVWHESHLPVLGHVRGIFFSQMKKNASSHDFTRPSGNDLVQLRIHRILRHGLRRSPTHEADGSVDGSDVVRKFSISKTGAIQIKQPNPTFQYGSRLRYGSLYT